MKKKQIIIGLLAIVLIIGGLVWVAQRFGIGKEETKTGPVPQVQVAKVERKSIIEKVIVYGSVVAQPGKTHSVSIAFETRVRHVLVAPGQRKCSFNRPKTLRRPRRRNSSRHRSVSI
ncbi:MAG: hypothetical protein DMF14_16225 [Verrucomicrobia bacterium]|nr:MAG: hypothetical protein DMF14_16225 [Verrucomicrobiota bacterium]